MPSPHSLPERLSHKLARSFPARRADLVPSRPIVSFSFDDVPVSALRNGAGVLERHGVRGTFYVAGGIAGADHDGQPMLSAGDYRDLAARGHEIGHHTFTHRTPWTLGRHYSADLMKNDIFLAPILGTAARNFAFPYGRSSPRARSLVAQRFRSSRGVENGINRQSSDLDLLRAVGIEGHMRAAQLIPWIDDVANNPGWLIFLTHDVQSEPSAFGTTPDILDALVCRALERGAEVLTVDAALDRLEVPR
jgi:peptidoglycan/xylan/chitin deacetylase (PgdA/CDA1 family)